MHATLTPAFGRDYKSAEKALQDWEGGKDWIKHGPPGHQGGYCSIRDSKLLMKDGITAVRLRFDSMRKLIDVPLKEPPDG